MPTCVLCGHPRRRKSFVTYVRRGEVRYRNYCKTCHRDRMHRTDPAGSPEVREKWRTRRANYERTRSDPSYRAKWILVDAKKIDRRLGFERPQLEEAEVSQLIQQGCAYCGSLALQMTLDRIDNARGHDRDNVKPACFRCNLFRGDMPWEAWSFLAPYVKEALKRGLFGEWKSQSPRRKNNPLKAT